MVGKKGIKNGLPILLTLVILVLVNVIGGLKFWRIDMTSESRYSLTNSSIELAKSLDDAVFIRVYLDGDLPTEMKRLRQAVDETLAELKAYGGAMIQYEFVNPATQAEGKDLQQFYKQLQEQGLQYTNLYFKQGDEQSQKVVFPGAMLYFGEKQVPVNFLKSQFGAPPEVALHQSIQELEYTLVSGIKLVSQASKRKIGWLRGQGELNGLEVADVERLLVEQYDVGPVIIDGQLNALDGLDALIVAGPSGQFSRKDLFVIDQFIMKGGHVAWFVEGTNATMDSVGAPQYMAMAQDNGLSQMLFKYGWRVNNDLVMDQLSKKIGLNVAPMGQDPVIRGFNWPFSPFLAPGSQHPVVKNGDALMTSFVSTVDTLTRDSVRHTTLLNTSSRVRMVQMPYRVSFDILNTPQDPDQYNAGAKPVAVLSEGKFTSFFEHSAEAAQVSKTPGLSYLKRGTHARQVLVADADILKNMVNYRTKEYLPLGHDRYSGRTFGNADFVLNTLNYLCEEGKLIEARNKDFKLRMMDPARTKSEAGIWQLINVGGPVLLIVLFGVIQFLIRRKRFTS